MKSMTGYARSESEVEGDYLMIEIKGVNNRYLDIGVNVPFFLASHESKIRTIISGFANRGKIDCTIRYRQNQSTKLFDIDEEATRNLAESLRAAVQVAGIDTPVTLDDLLRYDELIRRDPRIDVKSIWKRISADLSSTLEDFDKERTREGLQTHRALSHHRSSVGDSLQVIEKLAGKLEETITISVRQRFESVLGNRIDEDRVLAEIGTLLVKFSIDEEISRLHGHLAAFDETIESRGPVGKKLDFLCQELNREINTIGSKSTIYEINRTVVEAKDAIEKMREQLRNVE